MCCICPALHKHEGCWYMMLLIPGSHLSSLFLMQHVYYTRWLRYLLVQIRSLTILMEVLYQRIRSNHLLITSWKQHECVLSILKCVMCWRCLLNERGNKSDKTKPIKLSNDFPFSINRLPNTFNGHDETVYDIYGIGFEITFLLHVKA